MTLTLLPAPIVAAFALYIIRRQRILFHSQLRLNQVIPLQGPLNKILFTVDTKNTMTVWSSSYRKLYKISRDGNLWHIQTPSGKNLATVKNSYNEKYIVLAASSPVSNSPLLSTPSVIRMDNNMFSVYNIFNETSFSFGSSTTLRWCGLDQLEIVGPYFERPEGMETIRERVAFCDGVLDNSLVLLFDLDKINMEVLVATFLLALLCEGTSLDKARAFNNKKNNSKYNGDKSIV